MSPSYMNTLMRAREMAMAGHTAVEISDELDLHLVAAIRIHSECKAHKAQMQDVLARTGTDDAKTKE